MKRLDDCWIPVPYSAIVLHVCRSEYALYDYDLATYGATDSFDRDAAAGFIQLHGLPTKVWARQRRKVGREGEI
ncbi:MAG: hypothetical protein HGA54_00820 [Actinobacteria bacterium]|nr:hypothetical protein [Actinomycetota bacterium]